MRVACSLLTVLLCVSLVSAQQTTQTAQQRDSQSVAVLSSVVSAMGATSSLQSVGVVAHGNSVVPPAGISGPILWENQGSEFRFERPGPNGTIVFVSGHGDPALNDGVKIRRNIGHLAMNLIPPHLAAFVLAANLGNAKLQISAIQQVAINGSAAFKISTVDTTDEYSSQICKQDWYLDPNTHLPLKVDFVVSDAASALNTSTMSHVYSDYRSVSGVYFPFHIVTFANGQQVDEVTFSSIQVGVSIATSDFDAPARTQGVAQ